MRTQHQLNPHQWAKNLLQLSPAPPATEGDGLGQLHADGLAAHQALAQAKVGFELTAAQAMDVGLLEAGRSLVNYRFSWGFQMISARNIWGDSER